MNFKWIGMNSDGSKVELIKLNKFTVPVINSLELANSERLRKAVVLDIETTGLDILNDEIIEIAARSIYYDQATGELVCISKDSLTYLNEPNHEIPQQVTRITGISKTDVQGKKIDWNKFLEYIKGTDLLISHNAPFDRPFIDRVISYPKIPWGCSVRNIDWKSKGYDSSKLDILSIYHGFFNDNHRAERDVESLIHLMSFRDQNSGKMYFSELLVDAFIPRMLITVSETHFEVKEAIKKQGYHWTPRTRSWSKIIKKQNLDQELSKLGNIKRQFTLKYHVTELALSDTYMNANVLLNQPRY